MDHASTASHAHRYLVHQNLLQIVQFPEEGIYSQVLVRSELCTYTLFGLAKGNSVKLHASTGTTTIQVMIGNGLLRLVDSEVEVESGTFLFIPAQTIQGIYAIEDLAVLHLINHE